MYLYVAADNLDLQALINLIIEYLRSDYVNTNDLSIYIQWAHKYGYIRLKLLLIEISRSKFGMSLIDWREFIKNMCDSLTSGIDDNTLSNSGLTNLILQDPFTE